MTLLPRAPSVRILSLLLIAALLLGQAGCSVILAIVVAVHEEKHNQSPRQPATDVLGLPPGTKLKLAAKDRPVTIGRLVEQVRLPVPEQGQGQQDPIVRLRADWGIHEVPLSDVLWIQTNPHSSWAPVRGFLAGAILDVAVILLLSTLEFGGTDM